MAEIIVIAAISAAIIFLFKESDKYVTAYSGNESDLSEANNFYWLLRNNNIPVSYVIPYNWENFSRFGYKRSSVYIKVAKKDIEKAREVMMYYRAERLKMKRNMEAVRNR
ncbi:hypothetical protein WMZ97_07080 [Lentibacillus sp. N15]|uniref:hypothetical protein n=1 Tax=Lentibacillus songyuanensis TaxID=3136161 RepID=UPI0031BBA3B2